MRELYLREYEHEEIDRRNVRDRDTLASRLCAIRTHNTRVGEYSASPGNP